jgi:predicted permease
MNIVSLAIIKLVLVAFLGFFIYRRKFLDGNSLNFLTFFVINISIPFLVFSRLIEGLKDVPIYNVAGFLFLSFIIFFVGLILGIIFSFKTAGLRRREFISQVSFQNSGYLPMNIAFFLFSGVVKDQFLVYTFLYLLGFNIIIWSVGSFFIFRQKGQKFQLRSIFNSPVIGASAAILFVYLKLSHFLPEIILGPMRMVGNTSFVLSMIILGGWLAQVRVKSAYKNLLCIGWLSVIKLIIMPLIFFVFIVKFQIFSLIGLFILMQAAMPSATSLPIIASLRGGDSEYVSQGVFLTHLLSIFTIPLWVGMFLKVSGFSF